ncbi:MAG: ParB N-terminal domain-containing protein [Chloroflexi bacterium]|nr:ParB N-terminal domain-containing protein [Chloroflexota bacterium]
MSNAARKRGVRIDENLFDVGVAASEGYGHDMGAPVIDIQTKPIIRAKPIDIFNIQPNPMQPRRVVPSRFRSGPLMDQIEAWLDEVETESGRAFPLEALIMGKVELRAREDRQATAHELPLLRLADLAASIRQDGLTNPVTVVGAGDSYLIETGERRWLAYHLLNAYSGGDAYRAIPARRVAEINLWRQASENSARDNLNAIARARQIALLLMDMHGWEHFEAIETFDREQDFYAQVADSKRWRVPYGRAEQLCAACGFENASRIRQYRALLRLTQEQWIKADELDIAEFELRKWLHPRRDTAVTKAESKEKTSTLPGALERFDKHVTKSQFDRLDPGQQQWATDWMKALLDRMERWGAVE